MTEEFHRWADIAAGMLGPDLILDVCTVDAIVDEQGRKLILEVNGTSSGLFPDCAAEDNALLRDLVIKKLNTRYIPDCTGTTFSSSTPLLHSGNSLSPSALPEGSETEMPGPGR